MNVERAKRTFAAGLIKALENELEMLMDLIEQSGSTVPREFVDAVETILFTLRKKLLD